MKLIMAALKIKGMDNMKTVKNNIGTLGGAKIHNECVQHEFKENEVIIVT
jgi:hypothetical protein